MAGTGAAATSTNNAGRRFASIDKRCPYAVAAYYGRLPRVHKGTKGAITGNGGVKTVRVGGVDQKYYDFQYTLPLRNGKRARYCATVALYADSSITFTPKFPSPTRRNKGGGHYRSPYPLAADVKDGVATRVNPAVVLFYARR